MSVTPRLAQLLKILIESQTLISLDRLAKEIHASRRTVFRELENIDRFLEKHALKLEKKTGVGMCIKGSEKDKQKLLQDLALSDELLDKNERQERLILEILKDKSPQKIFYFANMFKVSESTISNDLEELAPWFENYQLCLIRKPGYGVCLEGSEENYRRAMMKLVYHNIDHWKPEVFFRKTPRELAMDEFVVNEGRDSIYQLLNREILKEVRRLLENYEDERLTRIVESSYLGFVINLTICVERILKKEKLLMDSQLLEEIKGSQNFDLAQKIGRDLKKQFQIDVSIEEMAYICIYFNGAKLKYIDSVQSEENKADEEEVIRTIHQMMDCYQPSVAYELKLDEELIEGLVAHLLPTLTRLKYGIELNNPMLKEVKQSYAEIFEYSKKAAEIITKTYGYEVPEDEIGFLSLHFGAAMVRIENRKQNRKVTIAVVCDSGIGISRLMGSRIKTVFSQKATLLILGKKELIFENLETIDFLVSTFEIEDIKKTTLIVNPILLDEDLERISEKIKECASSHREPIFDSAEAIDFKEDLKQLQEMMRQMESILNHFMMSSVKKDVDVEGIIEIAGQRIGKTEEEKQKISEVLLKREKIATQVIKEFGFALFHSRTDAVEEAHFSLLLPEGGVFTSPKLERSRVAIVMLIPLGEKGKSQTNVMGSISTALIEDEAFLEAVKLGKSTEIKIKSQQILKQHFIEEIKKSFDL